MDPIHILVVDDEPGITQLCVRLLERAGYKVTSFNKAKQALDYLSQNQIDLLLVDIRMPDITGFDLINGVRAFQPDMAVLIMTGFGTLETAIQALRQGVDGLILKPFDTSTELLQAVRQALADSQQKRDSARTQALRPLFDVTESLLAETRTEKLIDLVINAICGYLNCDNSAFYLYDDDKKVLSLIGTKGTLLTDDRLLSDNSLVNQSFVMDTPIWVNIDGRGEQALQNEIKKLNISSAIAAPIIRKNLRGVLVAARMSGEGAFREVDVEMFLLLVRQAAIALENAQLYEELRGYVRRVEESQLALIRAEKLASAGRLTASIAHEINNPLQAVQNCMHLATRKELSTKKKNEYLALANVELERLMATVQKMLDFYRPGAVQPQLIDIFALIKHVTDLLAPQMDARGIRITISLSSKLPQALGVFNQLEQVLINLMLNAYDAMPEGGEIKITGRAVRGNIELFVQDTGPGIPEEMRSHIFEPFVSTKQSGTGIGLSVSYGIIAAHGGNLDLIQDHGKGANFKISLPVAGEK
jgi:two-component system, NtrC family, sensor kinase